MVNRESDFSNNLNMNNVCVKAPYKPMIHVNDMHLHGCSACIFSYEFLLSERIKSLSNIVTLTTRNNSGTPLSCLSVGSLASA